MQRARAVAVRAAPYAVALVSCVTFACVVGAGSRDHVTLFPRLQPQQTLWYQVSYHENRTVKSESRMVLPNMMPDSTNVDVHGLLRVRVLAVTQKDAAPAYLLETEFEASRVKPSATPPTTSAPGRTGAVTFTLLADGTTADVHGLDQLSAGQQSLWSEWLSRFAAAGKFPKRTLQRGSTWEANEPEAAASPISSLWWKKKSHYVDDQPCRVGRVTKDGEAVEGLQSPETCAVVMTNSELLQKSRPKDATPEDFRTHGLRTAGTASGSNEVYAYISLASGLLVRAREEGRQAMQVTIAKADGSNAVHYDVEAESHAEVLQVAMPAAATRK